jgi:phosphonate transport system substrate-binding protein
MTPKEPEIPMGSDYIRRWFLAAAVGLGGLIYAGWLNFGQHELPKLVLRSAPILNFGFLPYAEPSHMRALYSAVAPHLAEHLKMEVRFILAPDYLTMGRMMESQMVDMAWFTPASYARIARKLGGQPICKPFRRGGRTYRPIVVVRKDSRVKTLKDLKGARFAYMDRNSTSGFIMANQMLAREGIDEPLEFFSSVEFTYSHSESLRGVKSGKYDSTATYEGAVEELAAELGDGMFRTIAIGPTIPNDPIVLRSGLDPKLVARIRELMLNIEKYPSGQKAIEKLANLEKITRFVPTRDADYKW